MEDVFNELLPTALQCGIGIFDFWELTFGEIVLVIEAHNRNEKERLKEVAVMNYQLANLIGISVSRLLDKDAKYPSMSDAFPTLFDEVKPQQQDWRLAKDRMLEYTQAHNKKRGE